MKTSRLLRRACAALAVAVAALVLVGPGALAAIGTSLPTARLSGEGSSWAGNAVQDWQAAVKAQGVTVDFNPNGSSSGRRDFATGLADYAVSEIPYTGDTADPQDTAKPNFAYGMLPVVAGGTSFMYNLPVNGNQFQNLRLSQLALAKIFSGQITQWNDPAVKATNPGVNLPAQRITVVVRSDGSGATAEFTLWMKHAFPAQYAALCAKAGCNPNSATSYYPTQNMSNFTAQSGSNGVTTYTANTPYTINYDEYSYALGVSFPVAQIQNAAGYFTVPSADAVAVALTQASINQDKSSLNYLSQDLTKVYSYGDPRTYPISAYSYMIEPTVTHGNFDSGKGETLAYFEAFSLCEGQRTMGALGYSPLPMNLVLDAMEQVKRVPGIGASTKAIIANTENGVKAGSANPCNNPTFRPGDNPAHNLLTDTAPFPAGCNAACAAPWARLGGGTSTGGTKGGKSTNGSGTGTTAPVLTPGVTSPGSGSNPAVVCSADTGVCTGPATTTNAAGANPLPTPLNLTGQSTWGVAQTALLLSVFAVAALMFMPPLVSQILGSRRPPGAGSPPEGTS
ncbi:phosphate ABC transporter substrate-binding protein PstS [Nocardioides baekrokdamisoli]|uniref:Phosphate ABC transporter substrate-binding protein PstS n=1 Tax=Nocardioides baekrokdamisoli TaxID=1804624 RepID=A0A3G9IDE7_9ACTN|nr:substrate-binding domain-containing protein [Nocardioides baekrokdamisoli]BBH16977.1 phosphate ABC transporter substrate-binding protein PstS [Nocardioides baekrokdamisoli]